MALSPDSKNPSPGTADPRLSDAFRNPDLADSLIERILLTAANLQDNAHPTADTGQIRLMEVCGTHTMSIAKNGLRELLPPNIRLLSGPGCPVCVTANSDIDRIIALTHVDGLTVTTFGDMLRVPGSSTSLAERRAEGALVEVVYSPLDALQMAVDKPDHQIVFIAVGFETTAPIIAATILRADALKVANFTVFSALKRVPPALVALLEDSELILDGLILPGHVSTILGEKAYDFIARDFNMPAVITGFEPLDILAGIAGLLEQLTTRRQGQQLSVSNAYTRAVQSTGNQSAKNTIDRVFCHLDSNWRGLGAIPDSGFCIRPEFSAWDATLRFDPDVEPTIEPKGCRCGDVLRGVINPPECPLFGNGCTPIKPLGPCMVSSEGSCAAWYRYATGAGKDL
jgi:hydrogenase expression/formation protein HypD